MNKNYCIYICIFSFILLNVLIIINCIKANSNQDNYFRLHVVANSNLIDDQIIKLNVSKKITNYISTLNLNGDKNSTKKLLQDNISEILQIANNELKENGSDYLAVAKIGKISYDGKHSDKIDMEKGTYDSLQIVLGNGKGYNFWTLIFPYAYNPNFELGTGDNYTEENIQFKSGIIQTLKKVAKKLS